MSRRIALVERCAVPSMQNSTPETKLPSSGDILRLRLYRIMKSTFATISSSDTKRVGTVEVLLWCALAVLCVAGHLLITRGPVLRNDSYEYLSAAENFLAGRPGYTSIVYFDSERSEGRIPAPLTTFPAGFSFATSVVAATGLPVKSSALIVSVSALALLIPIMVIAARTLAIGTFFTRALLIWLIGNSWIAIYAGAIEAESLFTLVSFTAITLLMSGTIRAEESSPRGAAFVVGSFLVGLSYWVRYAGIFLLVSTTALFAIRGVILRDRNSRKQILALGLAAAVIIAGAVRNVLLVGNWKGGNGKEVHHPIATVLHTFLVSAHHLLLGGVASAQFGWSEAVLVAGAVAIGVAAMLRGRQRRTGRDEATLWNRRLGPSALLICYVAVYCAGMIYLGITSVISFDTRMFFPILPVVLLLLARLLQFAAPSADSRSDSRAVFFIGLCIATIGYLSIHARSYAASLGPAPHEIVARELNGIVSPGLTMRSWLAANVPAGEVIIANQGQACGYVLHRRTLALASQQYSSQHWDEAAIRSLMRDYHAHFLILFSGNAGDELLHDSAFLSALARGSTPSWLALVAHTRDVAVFHAFA